MNTAVSDHLSSADLQAEITRGGRFVAYQWCLSVGFLTTKQVSRTYFRRPGDSRFGPGFRWSVLTLLVGWWGIPWGPIYTVQAIWTNLQGGIDQTEEVLGHLRASGPLQPLPLPTRAPRAPTEASPPATTR